MMNYFREICMFLDFIVYGLIEGIFQLIIDLANLEIFSQSVVNEFSSRIYIVLGLVMLFKIIISFVQLLINPDKMDDKEQGMGSILKRVIISLALIFLVPSIFDVAREAQNVVLPIIPKVILGVTVDPNTEEEQTAETMSSMGRTLAFYSFLPFFNYDNTTCDDGSILGTGTALTNNTAAPQIYSVATAWDHVNDKNSCSTNKKQYKYNYRLLMSTFVGAYLIFSLVGVAVQVAIRAIKFAICEVIAPIPIASYIDPKMSQQAFDNWVNTSVKTYLDLFLNLMLVYFVVYVFLAVFRTDNLLTIYSKLGNNPLRYTFVTLFIIIGLCYFVKEAPQFFEDLLGFKGGNSLKKIFGSAAGVFGTAGGLASVGAMTALKARTKSREASETEGLQNKRGALAGLNATGRFLAAKLRGKKTKEAIGSASNEALAGVDRAIQRTAGYTTPGQRSTSREARAASRGYMRERLHSMLGMSTALAGYDAAIKAEQDAIKADDDVANMAKNHKIFKILSKQAEAIGNYTVDDMREVLRKESMDLETKARNGTISSNEQVRLNELRSTFAKELKDANGNGTGKYYYDWAHADKASINTQQAAMKNNAERKANDFTKAFRAAAGAVGADKARREAELKRDYGDLARFFGSAFLDANGDVNFDSFLKDGYHYNNAEYKMKTLNSNILNAIKSNSHVAKFFNNPPEEIAQQVAQCVTRDANGNITHVDIGDKNLYDMLSRELERISSSPEYYQAQADATGINNNGNNGS